MIDAHQHFWKFDPVRDVWIDDSMQALQRDFFPQDLAPSLVENKIAGSVAVQADQSENETRFLLDLADKNPLVKGVVGWVDLRSNAVEERLAFFSQYPLLKGFRHIVQGQPSGFLNDKSFRNGVQKLQQFGFTYDLLIYHNQLPEAIDFVSSLPNVRIVLDHLAKPEIAKGEIREWEKNIRALAAIGEIHCKVSGMVTESRWAQWNYEDFVPYLDVIMEAFGPSRLMYGSDWPVCLVSASYRQQFEIVLKYISKLSKDEQEKIMGRNTINFYHL
jgi:L-fuconolactonase